MAALPQTGITISMVGETLGTTSRDLGTLCKHDSVNMWSKNKPLNIPTTSAITDEMRKQKNIFQKVKEFVLRQILKREMAKKGENA